MKKQLLGIFLAVFVSACSTTSNVQQSPIESRGQGQRTQTQGMVDANGLPLILSSPESVLSERSIYFDLDRYEVREEYRALLGEHAKFLKENPQFLMLIQGNTDERGSSEYNLSLGQKRANAVRRVLTLLGVDEAQLESVSLGKEKPRALGHNEAAWAENRRADLLYRAPSGRGEF